MTRAREHLHLLQPRRYFRSYQHRLGDGYVLATRSRFIPDGILDLFDRRARSRPDYNVAWRTEAQIRVNVAVKMREMWG